MTIRYRRDTAANWTAANPVLASGQPGFELDTNKMKVGDGVTAWNARPYLADVASVAWVDVTGKPTFSAVATSGAYADLTGIPATFAPSAHSQGWATITGTPTTLTGYGITDAATSAQGALAATALQPGALIPWTDVTGKPVFFSGAYGDLTGIPATFSPSAHVHTIANVTGLQAALDGKQPISAVLTATTASFTLADETKLDGIAAGATANATDAALRDRATHSGTQLASTVSDFTASARAQVEATLLAGTNITLTPAGSGATRTITIAAAGGGAGTNLSYDAASRTIASDTGTDAVLPLVTDSNAGLVPAFPNNTTTFLRGDGTYAAPAGGGVDRYFGQLTSNYTLVSQTAAQKLFNWSANGAVTLPTGRYRFKAMIYLLSMSATSGNAAFSLAGTATTANIFMHAIGFDSTTPLVVGARGGSASVTAATPASMVTAGTGTGMVAEINGIFNVTVTGTVIPSIALVTASAAIVQAGSFFECVRIADTGTNTIGTWS